MGSEEAGDDPAGGTTPVVDRTVPPGSDARVESVWDCKERIRRLEGLLVQRRAFFDAQYRASTCYLAVALGGGTERPPAGDVVGFALVRPEGYLSLLGVAPGNRRRGHGSRLMERVVADHPGVACHVRTTNGEAIGFYADHGLLVDERVPGYYRDSTDAYRLRRSPERADGIADLL